MSGKCLAMFRELKGKETPSSTNGAIYHLCKYSRTDVTKNNKKEIVCITETYLTSHLFLEMIVEILSV